MTDQTLSTFLASLAAGGGTFLAAKWLLGQAIEAGYCHTRRQRFFAVYLLSFILAAGAYGLQVYLGYAAYSPDGLFAACVTAFAASQALWGIFEAKEKPPQPQPAGLTVAVDPADLERLKVAVGDNRSLAGLLPANVAFTLAKAGFTTVQDVKNVTDAQLLEALQPHGLGPGAVKKIYEAVK
jgi:hypothetical protein